MGAVGAVGEIASGGGFRAPPDFERLGAELVEVLTTLYLTRHHPVAYHLAVLLTLIDPPEDGLSGVSTPDPTTGELARFTHARPRLRLERLVDLIEDPGGALRAAYLGPGGLATRADATVAAQKLFPRVADLLSALGVKAVYGVRGGREADPRLAGMLTLEYTPPLDGALAGSGVGAGVTLLAAEEGGPGVVVVPAAALKLAHVLRSWRLDLELSAAIAAIAIRSGGVQIDGPPGTGSVAAALTATKLAADGAAVRVGSTNGTRLELGALIVHARGDFSDRRADLDFGVDASSGALVIAPGDGDGFLARVLPAEGLRAEFDLGLGWSTAKGLYFRGAGGLDAVLPVKASLLGALRVDSVQLALRAAESGVELVVAATGAVTLGPVTVAVDRVGLEARLTFPPTPGNLGPAALELGFKPPSGAALKVDAAVAKGGGYLFFDPASEQYAGVVKLVLGEKIALTAIGLLTTRMPDGSRGFSLLLIVTAEGFSPIPLGFGFTLAGVGGLLGVNRTANVEALRAGVRTGALDSLLFPADPVRNAPAIVSGLNAVIPAAGGRFLLGPMALVTWGTPTILRIKLALLLEIPQPVRLIALARLEALLPSAEKPLVQLRMDAVGVVDFDRGELSLDAALFDSRLLQYTLTGDMALRTSWGPQPTFVLAVGGFHPRFPVPAGFPKLGRLSLSLAQGKELTLRLDAYVAVTSNSVQLGARVDLMATAGGFKVEGTLGFDALVELAPFGFTVDLRASLALRHEGTLLFSVFLELTLSGPSPWHVTGRAGFKLLGVDCELRFERRFGPVEPLPPPEPVDVGKLLRAEVADPRNWAGELPAGVRPVVTLRAAGDGPAAVHPLATFSLRQRKVPLNRRITRYGAALPSGGPARFTLAVTAADQRALPPLEPLQDLFARGQFEPLSEDEKLTGAAFEPMESGFRLGSAELEQGAALRIDSDAVWETVVIDPAGIAT
jgi:hypothetical protein